MAFCAVFVACVCALLFCSSPAESGPVRFSESTCREIGMRGADCLSRRKSRQERAYGIARQERWQGLRGLAALVIVLARSSIAKPSRASCPRTEPQAPPWKVCTFLHLSVGAVNREQLGMADDREGVVDSSKTYTHKALARILGRNERWVIRSLIRNGVQCKKVGELIFVSGHQFNLWIQKASELWQDDESDE